MSMAMTMQHLNLSDEKETSTTSTSTKHLPSPSPSPTSIAYNSSILLSHFKSNQTVAIQLHNDHDNNNDDVNGNGNGNGNGNRGKGTTSKSKGKAKAKKGPIASLTGKHLSQKHELFTIYKHNVNGGDYDYQFHHYDYDSPSQSKSKGKSKGSVHHHHNSSHLLRYNDTISFLHEEKAMGVAITTTSANANANAGDDTQNPNQNLNQTKKQTEIGFFRRYIGQAEQWKILPLDYYKNHWNRDIIQAGMPMLLQNELTGGLLSLSSRRRQAAAAAAAADDDDDDDDYDDDDNNNDGTKLTVRNFQMDEVLDIDVVHHDDHNLTYYYGREQVWVMDAIHTPPNPHRVSTHRPYLNGQHLFFPHRHDVIVQKDPFSCSSSTSTRTSTRTTTSGGGGSSYYSPGTGTGTGTLEELAMLDVPVQDCVMVEEVLGALLGLDDGQYIRYDSNPSAMKYVLMTKMMMSRSASKTRTRTRTSKTCTMNANITQLVERILPTASQYVQVNAFVSTRLGEFQHGKVSHALCGAVDTLLQDYMNFIIALDDKFTASASASASGGTNSHSGGENSASSSSQPTPTLTLNGLWGEMQSSIRTIAILERVVKVAKQYKGGALLNALETLREEYLGDDNARVLFRYVLEKASIPYIDMLRGWVQDGTLHDPFAEFMVEESSGSRMKSQDFCYSLGDGSVDRWGTWYSLKEEHVLNVMRDGDGDGDWIGGADVSSVGSSSNDKKMNLAMKILTTGKYWNATSLCKHRDKRAGQLVRPRPPSSSSSSSSSSSPMDTTSMDDNSDTDPRHAADGSHTLSSLSYGMGAAEMSRCVGREYEMASRTFLNIFMRDYRTLDVLAFMKRYFLLDQGDFFVHFLDMAEDELLQEMSDVSRGRVQNWMAVSIQMSGGAGGNEGGLFSSNHTHTHGYGYAGFNGGNGGAGEDSSDSASDIANSMVSNLTGAFATDSLISHLDALHAMSGGIGGNEPKTPSRHVYGGANKGLQGMEAFMLDFHKVPFPLSLILSRHSIANYQLMFRHLFFAKHVERRLVGTWLDHQVIKEYQSLRKDLGRTYFLRQRMLHFSQNFVYYILFEVIEPNWLWLKEKLSRGVNANEDATRTRTRTGDGKDISANEEEPKTVDDVLRRHNEFVQKTLSECLLSNRNLIRILTKLMTTCLLFTDQMKLFMETTQIQQEQNKIAAESRQKRNRKMYESSSRASSAREKRMKESIKSAQDQRRLQKKNQVEKLYRELNTESYKKMIMRFEQVFNSNLSEFMTQLKSDSDSHAHTHLANLAVRLDYNGYVTKSMGSTKKTRD